MSTSPPVELFTLAVSTLAETPGAIQQRVNRAYLSALSQVVVDDVPSELRARVERLITRLGATPITRTMMTDDEAMATAKEIVAITFDLCRHEWTSP